MFYKGQIEQINKVVVSDPSYKEDVWCRYESQNFASGPWNVQLSVNDITDSINGFELKGVRFNILLHIGDKNRCELHMDGSGFSLPADLEAKEYEIGMDTACVALGINDVADEIKASREEWKPGCGLNTLTDGFFGDVYEGSYNGKIHLLCVSGYLDEDTGYSVDDIVNYLSSNFKIENLELVKDKLALEDEIAKAKEIEAVDKVKNEALKDVDLEL